MNVFNRLKIRLKLLVAFGFCIFTLVGLAAYNYTAILRLGELQNTEAKRASDAVVAASALNSGTKLYQAITDAELNLIKLTAADATWSAAKTELQTQLNAVAKAADTPQETGWVNDASSEFESAIQIYEKQLLPALQAKGSLTPEFLQMNHDIRAHIDAATLPLASLSYSISSENTNSDLIYRAALEQIAKINWAVAGISVLLIILMATAISLGLTRNIEQVADAVDGLSAGDLTRRAHVTTHDEIGQLARGFNTMAERLEDLLRMEQQQRDHLQRTIDEFVKYMGRVSQGDLSTRLEVHANGGGETDPLYVLGNNLNEMTTRFAQIIRQIREATSDLTTSAAEILASTTQQASGSSEQSAAIAQTSTTVDEVKAIGEQAVLRAQEVVEAANRTVEVSREGQTTVSQTIDSMARIKERVEGIAENILTLSEQTQQIDEIITTVSTIASQSNMLALNASVEAARAGEHGKGFAVVAAEVRSLAEQSRQATAQVKAILQDIQKATNATVMATEEGTKVVEQGVRLAGQTQTVLAQLSGVINESAERATQVMAGGRQQTTGVEQIAMAMQNINQAMIQSLSSTRQAEKAAQDLNDLAQGLNDMVKQYAA